MKIQIPNDFFNPHPNEREGRQATMARATDNQPQHVSTNPLITVVRPSKVVAHGLTRNV